MASFFPVVSVFVHAIQCYVQQLLLQKGANFLHIACSEGSDKILCRIIGAPPPLLPDVLKELFMATDKVSECIHRNVQCVKHITPNIHESYYQGLI